MLNRISIVPSENGRVSTESEVYRVMIRVSNRGEMFLNYISGKHFEVD